MSKKFEKLLEAATDSSNLDPNWDAIIVCFDSIRGGEIPAKVALPCIQKRIHHENPHVVHHTLLVLDACVKNCGPKFHCEVATREFMEDFKNIAIENMHDKVKTKTLEMLQCWAMAFANKLEYKIVVDTHNLLKLAGFEFPSIKEADAMFMAQVAPDWVEGPECYRCRIEFGLLTRKHHCRACGQIFCDRCSSHEMALPQFGIEKEVRVCDACFEKGMQRQNEKVAAAKQNAQEKKMMEVLGDVVSPAEKEKLLREKEEEDLAKALQLSKIEAEAKEKQQKNLYNLYNGGSSYYPQESSAPHEIGYKGTASIVPESPSELSISADDPLAKYMNRDYWQQRKMQNKVEEWAANNTATAPAPSDAASVTTMSLIADEPQYATIGAEPVLDHIVDAAVEAQVEETTKWCQQLKEQVGVMENRIRSNIARGRPVVNDTAIQGLFIKLTEYHAQVLQRMHKLDEERAYHESLQDHLSHIVDARSAVNQLREDNDRRKKDQLEAEQRMRQAQMKQTLDLMRMKKHQMLLEQRDVALQRFQQQEQEMQARRHQQPMYPAGYMQQQYPTNVYSNQAPIYSVPYSHPSYHQPSYGHPQMPPQQPPQGQYAPGHAPTNGPAYSTAQTSTSSSNNPPVPSSQNIPYQPPVSSQHGSYGPTPVQAVQPTQYAAVAGYQQQEQPIKQEQNGYMYNQQFPSQHNQPIPQQGATSGYPPYHAGQNMSSMPAPAPIQEPVVEAALISFD